MRPRSFIAAVPMPAVLLAALAFASCGAGSAAPDAAVADAAADVASTDVPSQAPCTVLFGLPNEKTGLDDTQCRPECDCAGRRFVPPAYDEDRIAALEARVLETPMTPPDADPYATPDAHVPQPDKVCGVLPGTGTPGGYRLATYDDAAAAEAAGAKVSHEGACGLCSTLKDLAVYMRHPDLTDPVRWCGMLGMTQGDEEMTACLLELGFTVPCAAIWAFNTKHTASKCQAICLDLLEAPYHEEDGGLNACLQCDEDESGAVFKAVAGRTRRNTGLPSSMCRPCDEVLAVVHEYP
jgi:hypothetical protein